MVALRGALFPPNVFANKALCCVIGVLALRINAGLAVIAFILAGSCGGAAAQSYSPPGSEDFYPAPPQPYPAGPPRAMGMPAYGAPNDPYGQAPYLYRGANGAPPPSDPIYDADASAYPPDPYSPPARPYFVPAQPPGSDFSRPPVDVRGYPAPSDNTGSIYDRRTAPPDGNGAIAALPPEYQPERGPAELLPQLRRQLVEYPTTEPAGTVIIDTPHTYLYLVLGGDRALRYGIGVGREGFTWAGTERISRMTEWPDWHPPKEMIERQPYLPRFMAGGEGNPLGARALYLGNTLYRIHGTNQPSTIGHFVSSGCIRLTNEDIEDLYDRVNLGTRIVVLPGSPAASAAARGPVER